MDIVVDLGQAQLGARDLLKDRPVCGHVLDDCATKNVRSSLWNGALSRLTLDSELLLDVLEIVGVLSTDRAVGSSDRHSGVVVVGIH